MERSTLYFKEVLFIFKKDQPNVLRINNFFNIITPYAEQSRKTQLRGQKKLSVEKR